ncbi:hypothetical protein [Paraburkholderia caribensis]|uniref:hypothetical protein n=1 Tax=Paraburkholderia caribensis TaxID=75105 RepID=UPI001CB2728C|nr:hypothetical protein [Paraburkholderia caribensis]CAG9243827.1 Restriction endonuclease [Paraburkholderia caribensis]
MVDKVWQSYEEVAAHLLNRFAEHFSLGSVHGKQIVPGESGTNWEIDAKGWAVDGQSFVIVECKRYTTSRVSQAIAASLAWSIRDAGAAGGILVSPLGLQAGALKVAEKEKIHEVKLDAKSTTTDYVMRFLGQIHVGTAAQVTLTESYHIVRMDEHGNIIEERNG